MTLPHTLHTALRSLLRTRSFTAIAVLTLALGIGLSAAVFTVAEALLIRKLPVQDQDRLVTLWGETRDNSLTNFPLTLRQARDFASTTRTLHSVAWFAYEGAWPVAVQDGDQLTRLRRALVSGNYFEVLGARPLLGRTLQPTDDMVGAAPVAVLSAATWARQFGSDPAVVGRQFTATEFGTTYTIVGVMPAGLEYPAGSEFWTPFVPARLKAEFDTTAYTALDLVGRLAPGASAAGARTELTTFFSRAGTSPFARNLRGVVSSLPHVILGDTRPAVLACTVAAALLLLITSINVANLLLVRGLGRTRELAVRSALGAARGQLVTQLLAENALLALAGGVVGVGVAALAVQGFLHIAPASVPLLDTVRINLTALGGALGITGLAMLLSGLAPALVSARTDAQEALRAGSKSGGSRRGRLVRETLVAAQVALAVLMLSAAALLGRSFLKLDGANLAFEPGRLLIAELALREDQYGTVQEQQPLIERVVAAVRATAGVEAVSPVVAVPFSGSGGWDGRAAVAGQALAEVSENPMFNMELVEPEYFEAFGLVPVSGRTLTEADRDGTEPVVVVSATMARRYWPDGNVIGQQLRMGQRLERSLTVVGVVPDTRYRDLREPRATVYYPMAQSFFPYVPTTLAIRTSGAPLGLVPALRRAVGEVAAGVAVSSAAPFEEHLSGQVALPRLNAVLLAVFATAAVVLAAIGLFGVMATAVRQRTHELGVRMALGATARDVRLLVMGRGLAVAAVGVAVGLGGALLVNPSLAALLYEVSPTDAATLAGVTLLLLGVTALATFVPARASTRIEPNVVLRGEE
jgi:predicted permease